MRVSLLIFNLFLPCGKGKYQSQRHAEQCGEKHLQVGRQYEGDGMGGEPEERYRLLEHEAPLHAPVYALRHDFLHRQRLQQASQPPAVVGDMYVGAFMERHHHRSEDGVHQHADGEGHAHLAPREAAAEEDGRERARVAAADSLKKHRHAGLEDNHRHGDADAQHAPHQHTRQHAEALLHIAALAYAQRYHLAQRGEDGKLEEGHDERMALGGTVEPIEKARGRDEKRCQHYTDTHNQNQVGFLHNTVFKDYTADPRPLTVLQIYESYSTSGELSHSSDKKDIYKAPFLKSKQVLCSDPALRTGTSIKKGEQRNHAMFPFSCCLDFVTSLRRVPCSTRCHNR